MLNKKVLLPVLLVSCSFFAQAQKTEEVPPPPPPEPPKVKTVKFKPPVIPPATADFYKRNMNVSNVTWQKSHIVTVHLTDKSKEQYDISDSKQKKAFTDKYGELPAPPPPPPPPPPTPPSPPKVKA